MKDLVLDHFVRRGHGEEFEMEVEWVRRRIGYVSGLVVDVGCGGGALLNRLDVRFGIGVDRNADGLRVAGRRMDGGAVICADAERLPLRSGSVDAMLAQHVIEHIREYPSACREWHRALRPGGRLFVLTPNSRFCEPEIFDDETHATLFDESCLRLALVDAQFDIEELRTLGLPWFRCYHGVPGGWRFRRWVTRRAELLSVPPGWRWKGQTLCCVARRRG